jgi:hypothetical protein
MPAACERYNCHGTLVNAFKEACMNRPISWALAVAVIWAVSLSGCSSTTPISPTPTGQKVTETYSGTIVKGGAQTHTFAATAAGAVTATLNSLAPDSTIAVSITLGTWSDGLCSAVVTNNNAKVNSVTVGMATSTANLCLYVADIGNISQDTTYNVTVTHF